MEQTIWKVIAPMRQGSELLAYTRIAHLAEEIWILSHSQYRDATD